MEAGEGQLLSPLAFLGQVGLETEPKVANQMELSGSRDGTA